MEHKGFLDAASRRDLLEIACDGSSRHRLSRHANALLLLDNGMECAAVARVLFLDADTIRKWLKAYEQNGFDSLLFQPWQNAENERRLCVAQ